MDGLDSGPRRLTASALASLLPGSSKSWWTRVMGPALVERGVLRRVGHAWIGVPREILDALMTADTAGSTENE